MMNDKKPGNRNHKKRGGSIKEKWINEQNKWPVVYIPIRFSCSSSPKISLGDSEGEKRPFTKGPFCSTMENLGAQLDDMCDMSQVCVGGPMIVLMSHLTLGNWWFQILQNQILLMSTGLQSFSRAVFATWNGCGGCFPLCGSWCVLMIPCGEPQQGKQPPHRCLCKVNWSGREGTGSSSHHAMIKGWIQPRSSWKC